MGYELLADNVGSPKVSKHVNNYPTPLTINYFYGFGFLSGLFLAIQIISGMFVAVYYTADATLAFNSVEYLTNEVSFGWFFRNLHQTGASFFFLFVYIHLGRSLYFKSYFWPNTVVWWTGLVIFFLMVITAFLGYVLPWSQMGFWAATVITNLVTAIPVLGQKLVLWIWSGFAVQNITLKKFAVLHYCFPFVIVGIVGIHLALLHKSGSSDSLTSSKLNEKLKFYPYYVKKDLNLFIFAFFCFFVFVTIFPSFFNEVDIYTEADPLTGIYVIPEWYFLPIFGFIKCVRSKILGIFFIFLFFFVLAICPLIIKPKAEYINSRDQDFYVFCVLSLFTSYICLGLVAAQPLTEAMFILNGFFAFCFFFIFFLLIAFELDNNTLNRPWPVKYIK